MLDGRHRVKALKQLRRTAARCVIWHVDEAESLTLLATLNRLEGRDDPHKRAALLDALQEQRDRASLAADLPAPAARLNRMLQAYHAPPTPASPEPAVSLPEAMHFFFKPETRRAIEARLNAYDADRHQALLKALGVGHTVRVVPPRAAPVRKRFS
jgi:thioesterase domain-containing protein